MPQQKTARFVTGATWRHVIVMTLTNSIGLMALFVVDLIDLYFLNLLGEQEMAAAVGFAGLLLFFITAMSIGLLIAMGVLVSQRIGAGDTQNARQIAASTYVIASLFAIALSTVLFLYVEPILQLLGAKGRTLALATTYAEIVLPSSVILVLGMASSGILRAVGDARRAMNTTLIGAGVNLVFDPILIFGLSMGIAGAAWASVLSRIAMMAYGFYGAIILHRMVAKPRFADVRHDTRFIMHIAFPVILTNLATPIGQSFVTMNMAKFGDAAMAAYATIGRIIPVAFSILFALSGAIGPIIGQNFGAKQFDRVRETYRNAIIFAILVVIGISGVLFLLQKPLINVFNLSDQAAELLTLFATYLALFFIFDGILFSTNSAFNSLGYPLYSTLFNYAKFFLGIIPMAWVLSHFYGAKGVLIGQSIGHLVIVILALLVCRRLMLQLDHIDPNNPNRRASARPPLWPGSSAKSQV